MADEESSGTGRLMMPKGVCRLWPDLPPDRLKSWVESSLEVYTTLRIRAFPTPPLKPASRTHRRGQRSTASGQGTAATTGSASARLVANTSICPGHFHRTTEPSPLIGQRRLMRWEGRIRRVVRRTVLSTVWKLTKEQVVPLSCGERRSPLQ